jgi:hypothetical protein
VRTNRLLVIGLVVLLAIGLALFGRTTSGPGPDAYTRGGAALDHGQVPVTALVSARSAEGRALVRALKDAIAPLDPQTVTLIVADVDNPNEQETVAAIRPPKLPAVLVTGLDGSAMYATSGALDTEALKRAIAAGLKKPRRPHAETGHEGHSH